MISAAVAVRATGRLSNTGTVTGLLAFVLAGLGNTASRRAFLIAAAVVVRATGGFSNTRAVTGLLSLFLTGQSPAIIIFSVAGRAGRFFIAGAVGCGISETVGTDTFHGAEQISGNTDFNAAKNMGRRTLRRIFFTAERNITAAGIRIGAVVGVNIVLEIIGKPVNSGSSTTAPQAEQHCQN